MPKYDITKLMVLQDRPDMCRMVVVWPNVNHKLKGAALVEDWSMLACVAPRIIKANREILERLGIIKPKGKVEPTAIALVQRLAVELVQGKKGGSR